jgi:hypothetical protein
VCRPSLLVYRRGLEIPFSLIERIWAENNFTGRIDSFYGVARSARQPNPRGYSPVSDARSVPHSFARSWVAIHFALPAFSGNPIHRVFWGPFITRVVGPNPRASLTAGHSSRLFATYRWCPLVAPPNKPTAREWPSSAFLKLCWLWSWFIIKGISLSPAIA